MKKDMKANVDWVKDLVFVGRSASGHSIVIDGDSENSSAPSPMELLLLGAGGCANIDIVMILEKARQNIVDCSVELTGKRRDDIPRTFTHIHMHFMVSGYDLKAAQVERAVDLSMTKYCSASLTLKKACDITWDYEIRDLGTEA